MSLKEESIRIGKLYTYLVIFGSFVFLLTKPLNPANLSNNMIEMAKISIQSIIVNPDAKQAFMLALLLCTFYVAMETLVFLRDCAGRLYYKSKENNVTE